MARSARDIAAVLAVLVDDVVRSRLPPDGYMPFLTKKFDGLRVGFVDPTLFRFPLDFWTPSDEAKEQHVRCTSRNTFISANVSITG